MRTAAATLPGGYWLDGTCHREAELRPLTGDDEAWLLEADRMLPAHRSTAVLARCLTRLGPHSPVTPELVRSLSIGDREALLLQLRRLTFGNDLACTVTCPAHSCGEQLDLPLHVDELLLAPYEPWSPTHERTWTWDDTVFRICFHVPTGGDQEVAAAATAAGDVDAGASLLLAHCVDDLDPPGCSSETLPPAVAAQLDGALAELDPQAELLLRMRCPRCDLEFSSLLDAGDCLSDEVRTRARRLYEEVHLLALHYHWGERELMGMTARERGRYLGLLEEALAGASG
jgi:hypothetical protein